MFINRYKQFDIIEDHLYFLEKMKKLKLYMIELNKDDIMKPKVYSLNYMFENKNQ